VLTTGVATGLLLVPELSPSHAAAGPGVTGSAGVSTRPSASTSAGTPAGSPGAGPDPSPSLSADPHGTPSASGTPGQSGQAGQSGPTATSGSGSSGGGASGGSGGNGSTPPVTRPTVTVTATPTPRRGPECVINYNRTACSSNNPTVELQWYHSSGGDEGCTFSGDITWGDGTTSKGNTAGGPAGTYSFLAAHHYPGPGTYAISVQGITDSGFCLAFGYNATFTQTS
jgi:hypothetical protein